MKILLILVCGVVVKSQRGGRRRPENVAKEDNTTDFLVVSEQRSGSTWLRYTLSSLPTVYMFGEIFVNEKKRTKWPDQLVHPEKWIDWDFVPSEARHNREVHRSALKAVGFKAFHSTTKPPTTINHMTNKPLFDRTVNYLKRQKGVVIYLERKNALDKFISQMKTRRIGGGHCDLSAKCDSKTLAHLKLSLPVPNMLAFLRKADANTLSVQSMLHIMNVQYNLPILHVDYEALANDAVNRSEWRRILSHLRIPPESADLLKLDGLSKDIHKSHAEIIANFDQVQSALASTKFKDFLRSPPS